MAGEIAGDPVIDFLQALRAVILDLDRDRVRIEFLHQFMTGTLENVRSGRDKKLFLRTGTAQEFWQLSAPTVSARRQAVTAPRIPEMEKNRVCSRQMLPDLARPVFLADHVERRVRTAQLHLENVGGQAFPRPGRTGDQDRMRPVQLLSYIVKGARTDI